MDLKTWAEQHFGVEFISNSAVGRIINTPIESWTDPTAVRSQKRNRTATEAQNADWDDSDEPPRKVVPVSSDRSGQPISTPQRLAVVEEGLDALRSAFELLDVRETNTSATERCEQLEPKVLKMKKGLGRVKQTAKKLKDKYRTEKQIYDNQLIDLRKELATQAQQIKNELQKRREIELAGADQLAKEAKQLDNSREIQLQSGLDRLECSMQSEVKLLAADFVFCQKENLGRLEAYIDAHLKTYAAADRGQHADLLKTEVASIQKKYDTQPQVEMTRFENLRKTDLQQMMGHLINVGKDHDQLLNLLTSSEFSTGIPAQVTPTKTTIAADPKSPKTISAESKTE